MEYVDFVSNGCILFTIIMFSTGISDCLRMIRQKSTANIVFLPYLMTDVNCAAWMVYGRLTDNFTVVFVNVIGFLLQSSYIIVYLAFAKEKKKEIKQSCIAAMSFVTVWFLVMHLIHNSAAIIYVMGLISCTITVLMFSSPLSEINVVITNKSVATISFPLTVASILCAGSWTAFGLFLQDAFIIIPNVIGVATSLVRFYLFHKYPAESPVLPL